MPSPSNLLYPSANLYPDNYIDNFRQYPEWKPKDSESVTWITAIPEPGGSES